MQRSVAEHFPKEWGPGSHLSRYSEGFRKDFEKTMFDEVCRWNPSLSILEWYRSMALYFSRFTPDPTGEDLYSRLLWSLRDKGKIRDVVFASLNYDCIFEQAAYRLGLKVDYSGEEPQGDIYPVLKIHGSCNFITDNLQQMKAYLSSPGHYLGCGMNYLQLTNLENILQSKFTDYFGSYYPVMSLYSFGKNSIVAGTRMQKIRNTWHQRVVNASLVAVIGVRPNREDSHIWTPIHETSARLLYIGSKEHFNEWQVANHNFKHLGEKFDETFNSLVTSLTE
jgi:hypothetical protein